MQDLSDDTTPQLGGELDALNNKIVNLGTPTASADAVTKGYVDTNCAQYADTTANFTGTLQNGGSNVLVDTDIGSTVQSWVRLTQSGTVTYALPPTDGTAAQVLTTDGSGTLSWSTPASGGTNNGKLYFYSSF